MNLPKANTAAINALRNVETALHDSGITRNPGGMTDAAIARVVDAVFTAHDALVAAGWPVATTRQTAQRTA